MPGPTTPTTNIAPQHPVLATLFKQAAGDARATLDTAEMARQLRAGVGNRRDTSSVDGGQLYDAMAAKLMDQGVCVFRNSARGTKALVRYFETRLNAESLMKCNG